MKKIIAILFVFTLAAHAGVITNTYTFTDFSLNPINVRRVTQTPIAPQADYNGAILVPIPSSQVTGGSGSVTYTNTVAGYNYRIQIDTPYGSTVRTCGYPASLTGNVNGATYLGDMKGSTFYYLYPTGAVSRITSSDGSIAVTGGGVGIVDLSAGTNVGGGGIPALTATNAAITVAASPAYPKSGTNIIFNGGLGNVYQLDDYAGLKYVTYGGFPGITNYLAQLNYNRALTPGDANFGFGFESGYPHTVTGAEAGTTRDTEMYWFWNSPDGTTNIRPWNIGVSWGPGNFAGGTPNYYTGRTYVALQADKFTVDGQQGLLNGGQFTLAFGTNAPPQMSFAGSGTLSSNFTALGSGSFGQGLSIGANYGLHSFLPDWPTEQWNITTNNTYYRSKSAFQLEHNQSDNRMHWIAYPTGTAGNALAGSVDLIQFDSATIAFKVPPTGSAANLTNYPKATVLSLGTVQPDGSSIVIDGNGVISSLASGGTAYAGYAGFPTNSTLTNNISGLANGARALTAGAAATNLTSVTNFYIQDIGTGKETAFKENADGTLVVTGDGDTFWSIGLHVASGLTADSLIGTNGVIAWWGSLFSGNGSGITNLNASSLSSGTVPTARLGSGVADATTFLSGDQTWKAPPGGGGGWPGTNGIVGYGSLARSNWFAIVPDGWFWTNLNGTYIIHTNDVTVFSGKINLAELDVVNTYITNLFTLKTNVGVLGTDANGLLVTNDWQVQRGSATLTNVANGSAANLWNGHVDGGNVSNAVANATTAATATGLSGAAPWNLHVDGANVSNAVASATTTAQASFTNTFLKSTTNTVTTGNGTATLDFSACDTAYLATNANITLNVTGLDPAHKGNYLLILSNSAASGTITVTPTFILMTNGYPASAILVTNLNTKKQVKIISLISYGPGLTNGVASDFFMP